MSPLPFWMVWILAQTTVSLSLPEMVLGRELQAHQSLLKVDLTSLGHHRLANYFIKLPYSPQLLPQIMVGIIQVQSLVHSWHYITVGKLFHHIAVLSSAPPSDDGGDNAGAVIGAVLGVIIAILLVAIVILVIVFLVWR